MRMVFRVRAAHFAPLCSVLLFAAGHAQALSYFSGRVTDSQGNPVAGITIEAGFVGVSSEGYQYVVDGHAISNQTGDYAITALDSENPNGQYIIVQENPGYVLTVYPQQQCWAINCLWNSTAPPAKYPAQASGLDFVVVRSVSISGEVRRADTNEPLVNLAVGLELADTGYPPFAVIWTDTSGRYVYDHLSPGSYSLLAEPVDGVLLSQAFPLHDIDFTFPQVDSGDALSLQEGQSLTGVDFALNVGASISGTLTSAVNGTPVKAPVFVSRTGHFANGAYSVTSDARGNYHAGPFVSGSIYLEFGSNDYIPQFYPGFSTETQAQPIAVANGQQLNGLDAQLIPARTIAGTVTDSRTGQPLQNVMVHAGYLTAGFPAFLIEQAVATTDASGHYLLQGLDASGHSYYISADGLPGYLCQFYQQPTSGCFNMAPGGAALTLGDTEQKTGIDIPIRKGATVSGRVYDPDTNYSGPNADIVLLHADGNFGDSVVADISGSYHSSPVETGDYYLEAYAGATRVFYPNCFGCQLVDAQVLHFSAPQDYPNFDFAIPHLDLLFRSNFDQ